MPKHTEIFYSDYTTKQIFDIVADIEQYPKFLPWCSEAIILTREEMVLTAKLFINFNNFSKNYVSKIILHPPNEKNDCFIDVEAISGPFKHLSNKWRFREIANNGCEINFFIDFAFDNLIFETLISSFFQKAVNKMSNAFSKRALEIYG